MQHKYTAKIYLEEEVFMRTFGDSVTDLYIWMLSNADESIEGIHGEIIDNETNEVVQTFNKD